MVTTQTSDTGQDAQSAESADVRKFGGSKFGRRTCPTCKRFSRTTRDKCLWCGDTLTSR